jgi:hypothetical protein
LEFHGENLFKGGSLLSKESKHFEFDVAHQANYPHSMVVAFINIDDISFPLHFTYICSTVSIVMYIVIYKYYIFIEKMF